MSSLQEIWDRIDKCLTAFDEVIAEIGEEIYPAKDEYGRDVFETKLVVLHETFEKFQQTYDKLEEVNEDIMTDILDIYDE
jgi:chromosome condensin MukBEF complex kleisin-like MukF subunit